MDDDEKEPTAVEKYFFSPIYYPKTTWSIIGWWEKRRLMYNVAVGTAGLTSVAALVLSTILPPNGSPITTLLEPLGAAVVYGVAANICYSIGAPIDILLRKILGDQAPAVSQAMFRYGFAFSIGLTLLPIPVAVLSYIARLFLR